MSKRITSIVAASILVGIAGMRAIGCTTHAPPSTTETSAIGQISQATGDTYWTQVLVAVPGYDTSPPIYDPVRKVTVLATAQTGTWQTWEWNGTAWTMKCSDAACGLPTPGADSYTLVSAYDRVRNVVVALGEDLVAGDPTTIRTLEWNGATWATRCAEGDAGTGCGASGPELVGGVAFDQNLGRIVNFGGDSTTTNQGSLDSWDGTSWRHENTDDALETVAGALAFDPIGKSLVLFGSGGDITLNPQTTSRWTQGGGWTDVCGPPGSACALKPRNFPFGAAAMDPLTGRLFVFGGGCKQPTCFTPRVESDTWQLDGTNWTPLCGSTAEDGGAQESCGPPLPPVHGMTFDEARREVIMIGTTSGGSPTTEMWTFRTSGASCAADTDCGGDQVCSSDKVCCDQTCGDVCHTCLVSTSLGICTELTHGETDDTCNNGKACGANGACEVGGGSACTSDSQCASAHCSDGACCTTACDGLCDVCKKSLGASADGTCTTAPAGYAGNPSCGGFACDGKNVTCPASCATDKDCASGFSCISGKCEGVTCDGDHTVTTSDGTKIDCAPYKCGDDQACKKTCANVNDCSTPNVCNTDGVCVAPSTSSDSGGCSVSSGENTTRSIPTLLLGILAIALRRRRRRA